MGFGGSGGGGGGSIGSATDVAFNNPANNQVLTYDSGIGKWKNATVSATAGVTSVNTRTGDVTLAKTDVGLANVDNTSDANKPVSTATQTALNGKAANSHTHVLADITDRGLKVVAQATAPSDTSVIWVKTS